MIGKASQIKVKLLVEHVGRDIEEEITLFLCQHPEINVVDIKLSMVNNSADFTEVYHEAFIIYKEETK